jgi:AcrR family transcriptional regulator
MSGQAEWIRAAVAAMSRGGAEAVRVEALARDLGLTKGSFYWHFKDRPALLDAVLDAWAQEARARLDAAAAYETASDRLVAVFRSLARGGDAVTDAEVFAWARRERSVAERVAAIERERVAFIKQQLSEMGASLVDAHRRAEAAYLAAIAWLERSARTPWMKSDYGAFVNDVVRLLLRQTPAS